MGTKLSNKEIEERLSKEKSDKLKKETGKKQDKCVEK